MANLDALLVAAAVAAIYITLLRLVDLNEREPLWAMALFVGLGGLGGIGLRVFVSPDVLELSPVGSALWRQTATFAMMLAGVAILRAVARLRGWDEINDVTDGALYGAACGLGVALGELAIRELVTDSLLIAAVAPSRVRLVADAAAAGLTSGIFGACLGIGFGLAVDASGAGRLAPLGGLLAAVLLHLGFEAAARGNTLSGAGALVRAWSVLLLPVLLIAAAIVRSLRRERALILSELHREGAEGGVRRDVVDVIVGGHVRLAACRQLLRAGGLRRCVTRWALRNRMMMLAVARRRRGRLRAGTDPSSVEHQIAALRQSVRQLTEPAP